MNKFLIFIKNILNSPRTLIDTIGKRQCWNDVERTYDELGKNPENKVELMHSIQILIKNMRENGFDKTLYAYTSIWYLRISKKPFLDGILPSNSLFFGWKDDGICITQNEIIVLQLPKCEYCPEIEKLLRDLENS